MLNLAQFGYSPPSNEEIRAFVGNNSEYYVSDFAKFRVAGTDHFTLTWNWSAFGFTFIWMLYRKMYWQAVVTFLMFCTPVVNILMHIGIGCISNYLYFKHTQGKILETRQRVAPQNLYQVLQQVGGVHRWAITIGIVVAVILILLFSFLFASISTLIINTNGIRH